MPAGASATGTVSALPRYLLAEDGIGQAKRYALVTGFLASASIQRAAARTVCPRFYSEGEVNARAGRYSGKMQSAPTFHASAA